MGSRNTVHRSVQYQSPHHYGGAQQTWLEFVAVIGRQNQILHSE